MGFIGVRDRKPLCHFAATQALELRKYEAHPVACLATGTQLTDAPVLDEMQGINETGQIELIVHDSPGSSRLAVRNPDRTLKIEA
jgi:hypothetical protein